MREWLYSHIASPILSGWGFEMKVLVACEFSQVVTKAFRERKHEAYSCDILPTEGNPDWHIQGDVLEHLSDGWDLMIAHPPCTYLANSGVRWLFDYDNVIVNTACSRWASMKEACEFFNALLKAPIDKIVVENPIQHKYARERIRKYDQIIQPWQFGHGETKATCLWLKNLPLLKPTNIVNGREGKVWKMPPSENRWRERSRTFKGIAKAMAEQWGAIKDTGVLRR